MDLIIRASRFHADKSLRWALQLRQHDLSGTDYQTLAYVTDETARNILRAGEPFMLFSDDAKELGIKP